MRREGAIPGRQLGLVAAIALVVGNMIGSGVFLLPASLAPYGWNAVGGWLITISGALVLAWVLARLTTAYPDAQGAGGVVHIAFGHVPAFLVAWVYLVSVPLGLVTIAVAAVSYASSLVPGLSGSSFAPVPAIIVLLLTMTFANLRGVRAAGQVQVVTTLLKLVPLIVVIVLAAGALAGGTAQVAPFDAKAITVDALGGAAALTLFALLGFECACLAAARVANPAVNVPRATLWGTALAGLLYLTVSSAIALMLPLAVAKSSPAPFATFVERYWDSGPASLIAIFAIVSCVGAMNGWTLVQGELTRAMAMQGLLPRWLGVIDARGTPRRALIVGAIATSMLALMNASRGVQGLFEFLLLLSTSASLWFYLACALAALRLNVARPVAALGAVFALATLWGAGIVASGLSLVLMVAGLPLYWWARRERAAQPGEVGYTSA